MTLFEASDRLGGAIETVPALRRRPDDRGAQEAEPLVTSLSVQPADERVGAGEGAVAEQVEGEPFR